MFIGTGAFSLIQAPKEQNEYAAPTELKPPGPLKDLRRTAQQSCRGHVYVIYEPFESKLRSRGRRQLRAAADHESAGRHPRVG